MEKPLHFFFFLIALVICLSSGLQAQAQCKSTISAAGALTICTGQSLRLNADQKGYTYTWYKDGNELQNQKGDFITATTSGSYTVRIDNHATCTPESTLSSPIAVTVLEYPVPDFSFPSGDQCAGSSVKFTNTTPGDNLTYQWNFDVANTGSGVVHSTEKSPSHLFPGFAGASKTYKVRLIVTNSAGCSRTVEKDVVVKEGPDARLRDMDLLPGNTPFVQCSTNPTNVNYTVNVENTSSTKAQAQTYTINWGDGLPTQSFPASFTTASHTYTSRGAFKMVLTVTSSNGCVSTTTYDVYNGSNPSLSVGSPGNTVGCAPVQYTFPIENVANNSPATRYYFSFNDGTPPYEFTQENIPKSITHTFNRGSCGNVMGDAFTLTAIASNPCGVTPITVGSIRIASSPTADFKAPLLAICTNTAVELKNETTHGSTFSNTGACVRTSNYNWTVNSTTGWSFADGTNAASADPKFIFTQPGSYEITLNSINGCTVAKATKVIRVITPPAAAFSITPDAGCKDLRVTTTNTSTGDELQYKWSVAPNSGFTFASGTANSASPVFNFDKTGDYVITLKAFNSCDTSTVSHALKVKDKPLVTLPANKGYCAPLTVLFDGTDQGHAPTFARNNGTISGYTWQITGNATFVNGTTASSQFPAINLPDVGTYTVTLFATNECGNSEVATQVITIAPPVPNAITADQTICAGTAPARLAESLPSGQGASYVWEVSTTNATTGFAPVTGATESGYTPQALNQTAWFRRRASTGGCESVSNVVQITVNPSAVAPTLAGKTVCAGTMAELTVNNPGSGIYEWFTAATGDTPFHTGSSFDTPVLQQSTTYYVQTQSSLGCPSPRTAVTVTVHPVLAANTIGSSQAICTNEQPQALLGSTPTGGTGTFTYLWEQSTDNSTFAPAAGTNTSRDYQPPVMAQETWYRRRVTSGSCESISDPVQIVVNGLITNNSISAPQTICTGTAPTALSGTIPAGGDGNYAYRWEVSTNGATGIFTPAPGENDKAGYVVGTLTQTSWFRRVVLSSICANQSAAVEITVNANISNNLLPADQTVCLGNTGTRLSASLPTGGSGTYTYRWEVSTLNDHDGFVPAPGRNNEQDYTTDALNQTSWFRRRVTSGPCADHTSLVTKITVNEAISGNSVSGEQTICSGSAPTVMTGATPVGGSGSYVYLWESSTIGPNSGFAPAAGMNNGSNYQAGTLTQTTWFRRSVLSDPCTPLASNALQVTVLPVITNNTLTGTQTICTGSAPTALTGTVPAGGNGSYAYVWEISTDGVSFAPAPARNDQLNYVSGTLTQTSWFRRVVVSGDCRAPSDAVQVTVNESITANTVSQNQLICVGATPMELFGTDPQGGNGTYTYLWESSTSGPDTDFVPATGSNRDMHYKPGGITQTTWFRRVVSAGPCAPSYSAAVKITVTPPIANNIVSTPQAVCEGTLAAPLTGSPPTGGNGSYTYVWESSTTGPNGGFAPAAGVNNQVSYTPGPVAVNTWFRRAIYSEGCTNVSAAIQITITQPVANNNITSDQLVCVGTAPATLAGSLPIGGDGNYLYRWEISSDNVSFFPAPGTRNEGNYTPPPLTADTWFRRVVTGGPCAELVSNVVKVTVNTPVANNTIGSPQRICAGTAPGILHGSAPTGGSGTFTYLWEVSSTSASSGFSPASGINNQSNYEPGKLSRTSWFRRKVISLPCQESTSFAVLVTVDPQPAAPQAANGITCPGGTATLTASSLISGLRFEWYSQEEGGIPLHTGPSFTTEQLLATTAYFVQTVNQFGCASDRVKATAVVTVPTADAGPDVTILLGRHAQLKATGGDTYSWSPALGLSDPGIANPVATPQETTTYTVTVTTKEGCTFTDEVTVTVLPLIKVANAITMNGDGLNDTWEIQNIDKYPNCHIQIFTRWGALIFSSKGYQKAWDGMHNGKPLPVAAYYYIIDLGVNEAPLAGSITIVK